MIIKPALVLDESFRFVRADVECDTTDLLIPDRELNIRKIFVDGREIIR